MELSMRVLFQAVFGMMISVFYLPFYFKSRKIEFSTKIVGNRTEKIILCLFLNIFLSCLNTNRQVPSYDASFYLMMIIADIDLMISHIPTELLTILFFTMLWNITREPISADLLICPLIYVIWNLVRKKLMMGHYDILLVVILSLFLKDTKSMLLFNALFLLIYGISGLILKYLFSTSPETKIPLAPIIITAFQLLPFFH